MTDCTPEIMIELLLILFLIIVGIICFFSLFFYLLSELIAGCVRLIDEYKRYLRSKNVLIKHSLSINLEEYRNDLREGL